MNYKISIQGLHKPKIVRISTPYQQLKTNEESFHLPHFQYHVVDDGNMISVQSAADFMGRIRNIIHQRNYTDLKISYVLREVFMSLKENHPTCTYIWLDLKLGRFKDLSEMHYLIESHNKYTSTNGNPMVTCLINLLNLPQKN